MAPALLILVRLCINRCHRPRHVCYAAQKLQGSQENSRIEETARTGAWHFAPIPIKVNYVEHSQFEPTGDLHSPTPQRKKSEAKSIQPDA